MSLRKALEDYSSLILLLITASLLVVMALNPVNSPDLFWHLKLGEDLINRHLSPYTDRYSYEFFNHSLHCVPWSFEALLFLFYKYLGAGLGIRIFLGTCWVIPILIFFCFLRKYKISVSNQILGFTFLANAMVFHPEPRPELLSYSFILINFFLFYKIQKQPSIQNLFQLALLLLVWSNYHTSCTFGFLISGALYADLILKKVTAKNFGSEFKRFIFLGCVTFLCGFLNRDLLHPVLAQIFAQDWGRYITEYQSPTISSLPILFFVFTVITIPVFIYGLVGRKWSDCIILLVLFLASLKMLRLDHFFVFIDTPIVIMNLEEIKIKADAHLKSKFSCLILPLAALSISIIISWDTRLDRFLKTKPNYSQSFIPSYYPADVLEYMRKRNYKGNVINQFAQGSYILFAGGPDLKVFIDGRTFILYPYSHLEKYVSVITHRQSFLAEVENFDVNFVITPITQAHALLDTAASSGRFFLEFVGRENALLTRNGPFKNWTLPFVHPECINKKMWESLPFEFKKAKINSVPDSSFTEFLEIALKYHQSSNFEAFLISFNVAGLSDETYRLLATLSAKNNLKEKELFFYSEMASHSPSDMLQIAKIQFDLNHSKQAEETLRKIEFPRAQDIDFKRGYNLLSARNNNIPLDSAGQLLMIKWRPYISIRDEALPCP